MRRLLTLRSLPLLLTAALLGGGLASLIAGAIASEEAPPATEAPALPGQRSTPQDREPDPGRDGGLRSGHELDTYLTDRAAGEAVAAGPDPAVIARSFAELWSNRGAERALLRKQRRELVGLSRGAWARELDQSYSAAIGSGTPAAASEGSIVAVERAPAEGGGGSRGYLIITRERLLRGGRPLEPYRYATYLGRLERRGGEWAVSSWEPQL